MFYVIVASGECPGKCPWEYPDCMYVTSTVQSTDLHIYYLDAVPPIHIVSNHVDTDKLTTANGGTFTSSSASRSSQSR